MKGQSDSIPERIIVGKGKSHYNYNIEEVETEDEEGNPKTIYTYDYVVIEGKLTKAKIIKELDNIKLSIEEEFDPDEIEITYNESKEAIQLSEIANLTYSQLDTYIDNHVTDLASAKAYMKKLSKVVLAILRYSNIK